MSENHLYTIRGLETIAMVSDRIIHVWIFGHLVKTPLYGSKTWSSGLRSFFSGNQLEHFSSGQNLKVY